MDLARLPMFFRDYATLEAEALSFFWYGGYVVPGLLQSEEYARAVLEGHFPPVGKELLEESLSARMDRQKLLDRQNPPVVAAFLIEEAVLYRPVGGAAVKKQQLQLLLERGRECNIQIQIVPTALGMHPGLDGSMVLLETAEREQVAYVESQDIGLVVSQSPTSSVTSGCAWDTAVANPQRRGTYATDRTHHGRAMGDSQSPRGTSDLKWFKSSYSSSGGGACAEVASADSAAYVRDSKRERGGC
ncbi:DUF5753 domain-containing protein [Streptomyces sp. NPDC026589]|uniref:DUF5753 domain-containing protein n=1 Tax=Streptomyces sp. NPDC026589 TaxID=3155609 RepID=UPI003407A2E4